MPLGKKQHPQSANAPTHRVGRGRLAAGALLVVTMIAALFALSNVGADETPAQNNNPVATTSTVTADKPGVVPSVDLSSLEEVPIKQWGVVGTGLSYTGAKSMVWDFAEIGDVIYVGGIFTGVQQSADLPATEIFPQSYLAAFKRETGEWISTFRPQFNRSVYALEVAPDGNLLVGGEFTTVNGVNRGGLVKLDPTTGETVASFPTYITAGTQPMVRDIVADGANIYIAGQISTVYAPNGAPWTWNAARLDGITGRIDLTWIPRFMGGVWQLAIDKDHGRVHAAGFFTSVAGQSGTERFASITEDTGAYIPGLVPLQFNEPNGQRDTVAVAYGDGKVYVGGAQHIIQVLDIAQNNARLGFVTSGIACNSFFPSCGYAGGGDYQVLEIAEGGTLLGGCHCYANNAIYNSFTNSRTNNRFAHGFDTNTNTVPAWSPQLGQRSVGTYALFVDSNHCLYVGGDYVRRGDGAWLGGFGRFCTPNLPPASLTGTSAAGGVSVTWAAPDTPLDIAYYKVYRNGTFAGDTTATSYGFTGLPAGSDQTITVRTMDAVGRLSATAQVVVTVSGADTMAPTVPADAAGSASGQTVTLTWSPSTDLPDPGGVGLSGYLIHRDWNFIRLVPAGTHTFTEENVALGNRRYEIRGVDKANNFSAPAVVSVFVGIVDNEPPTVPTNLVSAVSGATGQTVTLTWDPSTDLPNPGAVGLSGYLIHRDWNFIRLVPAGTQTFTEENVALGNRRYEVRAVDLGNRFSAPATITVTTGPVDNEPPTVPTDVVGSASGTSVTLTWGPSTDLPNPGGVGLSGYLIHRDWNFIKFVAAGTQTFTDTDVPAGNRRYEVRSVDLGNRMSAPASPVIVTVGG